MIPETFISSLLERADIVDVVGRYVHLKKSGRNYMACCPFHKEKTPSFSVSSQRQFYKCFGCGKAGNAVKFIMEVEKLDFPDAVRKLADMYGMVVPEQTPAKARAAKAARTLTDYMKEAADFYSAQLSMSEKALSYLKAREIAPATARRFALGYSPDGWHSLKTVFADKYEDQALETAGLVNVKNSNRYDAFRDRLMFPIRNPRGQVIGFGARTFKGDEQPKYLNSPETPIYHKGKELYGLYEGRDAVYDKKRAIVCEGYMDVIQLSQAGFEEAVAALGTSITPEHVQKLFKITDAVYFSFDGDSAGRKAAKRALDSAVGVVTDVQSANFILLPAEHDPDSLIKEKGPAAFEEEIRNALTLTQFLKSLLLEGKDLTYLEDRARLIAEAKPYILRMGGAPMLRLGLMKELAALARVQLEDVEKECGLHKPEPAASQPAPRRSYEFRAARGRDGRYQNGAGRALVREARVAVRDVRVRMLHLFLSYPQLLSEFSSSIEEEFLGAASQASRRIVEVWQAARPADEDEGQQADSTGTLLARLSTSPNYAEYEAMVGEEFFVNTSLEAARLEVTSAFLEFEQERSRARLIALSQDPSSSIDALKAAHQHCQNLQKQIQANAAEVREMRIAEDARIRREAEAERLSRGKTEERPFRSSGAKRFAEGLKAIFGGAAASDAEEPKPQARSLAEVRRTVEESRGAPEPMDFGAGAFHEDAPEEFDDAVSGYSEEEIAREISSQVDDYEPIDFSGIDDEPQTDWSEVPQPDESWADFDDYSSGNGS